ncbi:MAG: GAK system ATP-grasp enzyme, partial [Nitrospinae bacterium]|nr:GAK system ATP-grasp enzyme [Nitrospinota bacterium]
MKTKKTKQNRRIGVVGVPGSWSSEELANAVEAATGFRLLIDMARVRFDLTDGRAFYDGVELTTLDALVVKKVGPVYSPDLIDRLELLRFLNERGLPIFSRPGHTLRLLDRLACTVTLAAHDIPMPETVVTEDRDEARAAVARFGKAVFKPLFSTKARGMTVIPDGPAAPTGIATFLAAGNRVMYIQKLISIPGKDLGVVFMGGEYYATYARRGSGGSWNTTTANGGKYEPYDPPKEIIELARRAQAPFGLDFTCVDVVETDDGPKVFEVSAFGGFRGLRDGNGKDAAADYTAAVVRDRDEDGVHLGEDESRAAALRGCLGVVDGGQLHADAHGACPHRGERHAAAAAAAAAGV